jgi:ABC-type uncharacterized transport system, periplasmic component
MVKYNAAFLDRLRQLGYIDGKTIQIHWRYAGGVLDRLPGLARELVALKVDVIVAVAVAASLAAREATARTPHCHGSCRQSHRGWINQEPVPAGWQRHWHDLHGTRLGQQADRLLHQVVPPARRIAFLSNPSNAGTAPWLRSAADAAQRLGLELVVVDVVARQDFEPAFARIEQSQAEALLVGATPLILSNREAVIAFAARRRLPTLYTLGDFVRDGGLMSYSTNLNQQFPRAADYVDKILKGASPAELPVEQPVGFEMLVNLKTARALNLELPPSLLASPTR